MFRTDIKPMYEDPENINGGKWTFQISKLRSEKKNSNDLAEDHNQYNDCWTKTVYYIFY